MSETQTATELDSLDRFEGPQANHAVNELAPADIDHIASSTEESGSTIPDGGYGWIVITACAAITWWFVGTTYSWGVIQAALVNEGLAAASTLSFVGSMTVACVAILALLNARLVMALGARKSGLIGIGLLSAGEIAGSFATKNVGGLFVTVGVLMGLGTRWVLQRTCTPHR